MIGTGFYILHCGCDPQFSHLVSVFINLRWRYIALVPRHSWVSNITVKNVGLIDLSQEPLGVSILISIEVMDINISWVFELCSPRLPSWSSEEPCLFIFYLKNGTTDQPFVEDGTTDEHFYARWALTSGCMNPYPLMEKVGHSKFWVSHNLCVPMRPWLPHTHSQFPPLSSSRRTIAGEECSSRLFLGHKAFLWHQLRPLGFTEESVLPYIVLSLALSSVTFSRPDLKPH